MLNRLINTNTKRSAGTQRNKRNTQLRRPGPFAFAFFLMSLAAAVASAQSLSPLSPKSQSLKSSSASKIVSKDLSEEEQKALANQVYQLTKTADSAAKLTDIVDRCRSALASRLTDEHQKYFNSLLGWSLAKRGEKRIDSHQQLLAIGNETQAKSLAENAKKDLDEAIQLNQNQWKCYLNRGILFSESGDLKRAADDFKKVCELESKRSYGWFNLAEVQFELEQFEEAKKNYEKALEISTSDVQSLTGVAHCLARLKDYDKSTEKYTVVIRLRPDSSEALINRGDAFLEQKKWKLAMDDYSSAADADSNPVAYQRAAWLMACCPDPEFFQPDTALMFAKKAQDSGKLDSVLALETLAVAQAACGDFESATQSQRQALAETKKNRAAMEARLEQFKAEKPFQFDK